eukprot:TRINITY_DN53882_c0_g1_i1.p1 TRINITY_DN53882_c0_g1~~TRINITY_DN53882_c0_g1_i1.p1  ORF type:complete len:382 (+),score=51.90 TRINITY_DN53882_c0_g1_i1:29-1174(+)
MLRKVALGFTKAPFPPQYSVGGKVIVTDPLCNVSQRHVDRLSRKLHHIQNHPLAILKREIAAGFPDFRLVDDLSPVVTVAQNFDSLLVPVDHVSRSPKDTYYFNSTTLLRSHTSAHQLDLLREGHERFLVCGDVYRRDEIDASHNWVFHQMEGVKVMDTDNVDAVRSDLVASLEGLVRKIFGDLPPDHMRWVDAYFPFTEPSFELEILFQGKWLEVLGCGVMQQKILQDAAADRNGRRRAWAFGLGLERWAMPLFGIPDIRLFWSENKRFLSQWSDGQIRPFRPLVSLKDYPPNPQDISFWVEPGFADNDFFDLVRRMPFCDLIEEVSLMDEFTHPRTGRRSKAFRLVYRSPEQTLSTEEVTKLQAVLRQAVVTELNGQLR